jgi:hypothetical protein
MYLINNIMFLILQQPQPQPETPESVIVRVIAVSSEVDFAAPSIITPDGASVIAATCP